MIAGKNRDSHLTDPQNSWRRMRAPARLPDVKIHVQHSFATRASAPGEALKMIGKLLGHTQVQSTARCAHLAPDTVKASATRIGDSVNRDLEAVGGPESSGSRLRFSCPGMFQ